MEDSVEALRRLAEQCVNSRGRINVQEATTNGLLLLLQLKEESRKLAFTAEDQRDETSKFKTRLEQAHLQLQNLIYEKEYYEKEIHECQNFRFKHTDSEIGLVPAEEFRKSASTEVQSRIGDDPHMLMLERLRDELEQRKAMVAKLEELRKAKATTRQEVDKRKRTLDDLQQQLQGLEDTAKPLQTILAPHLSLRGFARSADLLPLPLYIVYSQLAAVREALGLPIRVAILGSSVEAESFAKSQTLDPGDAPADAQNHVGGAAGGSGPPAEPVQKQPRLTPTPPYAVGLHWAAASGAQASGNTTSTEDLYKVHPLSVLLEVQRENNGRLQSIISVKFQFLVNLKLVTAHSEVRDDNLLLAALFPGDDGSATAFENLAQLQGGTFKYDTSRPAKPYRWCQLLAGLDFAPPLPLAIQLHGGQGQADTAATVLEGLESYRRQQRVIHVIDRLRAVKTGDEALKKILSTLDKAPNPPNLANYPKLPVTSIASVEEIKTSPQIGNGAAAAAGKGKDGAARTTSAANRSLATLNHTASAGGFGPQVAAALPTRMRAEAAAEDGEVGRRSSRPAASGQDGAGTPGPDGAALETATEAGGGGVTGAVGNGPTGFVAAVGQDAAVNGEAMEDGEAAEEGEAHGVEHEDGEAGDDAGAMADELIARYLLTDILAAEAGPSDAMGGSDTRPAKAAVPKPVSRLYRVTLRHKNLECEVLGRLFLEYPVRPPLLLVKGVREVARDRRTQPRAIEDVNLVAWLEEEANATALSFVPPDAPNSTLLYQLLHLRLAFDEFAAVYLSESGGSPSGDDLMSLLASKQRIRGRDRRAVLPVLPILEV